MVKLSSIDGSLNIQSFVHYNEIETWRKRCLNVYELETNMKTPICSMQELRLLKEKKYMDGSQKLSLENSSYNEILGSAHKDV